MRKILLILLLNISLISCRAQYSLQDTLRGSITPERAWWDVLHYDITVRADFHSKTLKGNNRITAKALDEGNKMQIDLQEPMEIIRVQYENGSLPLTRNGNVYYISFPNPVAAGTVFSLSIDFGGQPREAINAPWDGGWIWKKDKTGNPWISVACQLIGASLWYPCKDHQSDEPDSATLRIVVPDTLVGIGNGKWVAGPGRSPDQNPVAAALGGPGWTTYTWEVKNPINNYNIVPSIGKYVNWKETYNGEKGPLEVDYWALAEDEAKARKQFTQVRNMLQCFEHWFGPYPFYEDGYKIVESPHLGMEHQSNIAYGNGFRSGYAGRDISGTGWGDKWDFIIIHESGHEWFGNNITSKDVADMWIHEGFTNYSEALYTECLFGKAAGEEYCRGLRKNIQNDIPVIGKYGVHKEGSNDMYYKAANMVHIIRQIIADDEKFRQMLRGMNRDFYHQTVTTSQIEAYISRATGRNLSKIFDQYLRNTSIPSFEYKLTNGELRFRWTNCVKGFDMPLKVNGVKGGWLYPTTEWQTVKTDNRPIQVDENFYVTVKSL